MYKEEQRSLTCVKIETQNSKETTLLVGRLSYVAKSIFQQVCQNEYHSPVFHHAGRSIPSSVCLDDGGSSFL